MGTMKKSRSMDNLTIEKDLAFYEKDPKDDG